MGGGRTRGLSTGRSPAGVGAKWGARGRPHVGLPVQAGDGGPGHPCARAPRGMGGSGLPLRSRGSPLPRTSALQHADDRSDPAGR